MTTGVVIFAFDSGSVSYTNMAAWSARRIQQHLGLPVSLVTDSGTANLDVFDHVIYQESRTNGSRNGNQWKNLDRCLAYHVSPYEQTLLLDADYVVCSDQLKVLFDSQQDILSMRWAHDASNRQDYKDLNYFGKHQMPSAWATVMYWRRSKAAELIFDMMSMVQQNWQHYKDIYGITERRFRNDYALAIASNTVTGHLGSWPEIPWQMTTVAEDCDLEMIDQDTFLIKYLDSQNRPRKARLHQQDFHAMNKQQLGAIIGS